MAHELDFQKGSAAFVSLKQTAWHGLGTTIETEMSVAEAIKYAHLDFDVAKLPNVHRIPTGQYDAEGQIEFIDQVSIHSFFTYRTDTNFVLGNRVGKGYTVVQNEEALAVADALVQEGGLIIETAGSLHDGKVVFLCCRIPEPLMVAGKDKVQQYIVIMTGHDGNTPIMAYFTDVRVVCNNTLQQSFKGATQKHSIRHTTGAKDKLAEALKIMGFAQKNTAAAQETFTRMAETKLSQAQFWNYLSNIYLTPAEIGKLKKGEAPGEVISTRKQNIMNDVISFANNGIGQNEANPGSAWWAYNAVTGYYSNKPDTDPNDRMQSLLFGGASATMEKALMYASEPKLIVPIQAKFSAHFDQVNLN